MLRNNRIFNFTTALAILVVCFAPSTVADVCVWCDRDMSQTFLNCIASEILYGQTLGAISKGVLDDMKNSMIAASQAITKSSDSTKMKMMNGAMAGEFSELIKSQSSTGNPEKITFDLMVIVGYCYEQASGQPHYSFTLELGKTVNFMLNDEPPEDNSGSSTDSAQSQYLAQAFANSAVFSGQNGNNQPPEFNNAPQQQPSGFAGVVPNNFSPNQGNNPLPSEIPLETAPLTTGQGDINANAASLAFSLNKQGNTPYIRPDPIVQPQSTNANVASSSYSFQNNNWSNFAFNAATQQNSDAGSSSEFSSINQNRPLYNGQDQFLPRNGEHASNVKLSYPINNEPSFIPVPVIQGPVSAATSNDKAFTLNDQSSVPYYPQNQFIQNPTSDEQLNQDGTYSINNNVYNSPNQFDESTVDDNTDPSQNKPQPNYDYDSNYPAPVISDSSSSSSGSSEVANDNPSDAAAQGNGYPSRNSSTNNKPAVPKKKRKSKSQSKSSKSRNRAPPSKEKSGDVTTQQSSSPSRNDDEIARAMKFSETLYVVLSQSVKFKNIFSEHISNDKATFYVYRIVVDALNDCGYSEFSAEIANACIVAIKSLPEKCPFEKYGEAISKSLMSQFHMKKLIRGNPDDQAISIATALLARLHENEPSTSSESASTSVASSSSIAVADSSATALADSSANALADSSANALADSSATALADFSTTVENEKGNSDDGASAENWRSRSAREFADRLYNNLLTSPYFSNIYNKGTPKSDAKSCTIALLINSLYSDYGNKLAIEIAIECSRRLSSVQVGSETKIFASVIANCVSDVFSYYDVISPETPSAQASDISSKMIEWFRKYINNDDIGQSQDDSPNSGIPDYPEYSTAPKGKEQSTAESSGDSSSNSRVNTDSSYPNYDYFTSQANQQYSEKKNYPAGNENSNDDNIPSPIEEENDDYFDGQRSTSSTTANPDYDFTVRPTEKLYGESYDAQQSISTSLANANSSSTAKRRKNTKKKNPKRRSGRKRKNGIDKSTDNAGSDANIGIVEENKDSQENLSEQTTTTTSDETIVQLHLRGDEFTYTNRNDDVENAYPFLPSVNAASNDAEANDNSDDYASTDDWRDHSAVIFYDTLYYDLLASFYFNSIFNTKTLMSDAKAYTVAILIKSLYSGYANTLAVETAIECSKRLSTVQAGSETEIFATVIAKCVSDVLSHNDVISPDKPSAQASDISSKMIEWLRKYINNRHIGQSQDDSPNSEIPDYPDYSTAPKGKVPSTAESSGASSSNSRVNTDNSYPNYDHFTSQDSGDDYPYYTSNQKPDSSTDITDDYYYPWYDDYLTSQANQKSPEKKNYPAAENENSDDNDNIPAQNEKDNDNYEDGQQSISSTIANSDYGTPARPTEERNDESNEAQQSINASSATANSSSTTKRRKNTKKKNPKRRSGQKRKNGIDKSTANADSDANSDIVEENKDYSQMNPDEQTTLMTHDITTVEPQIQGDEFPDSTSNNNGGNSYPNTVPTTTQAQTIFGKQRAGVKDRVKILMKWALSSMSNGKFNYKLFSSVVSALAKYIQNTNPQQESQKCLLQILIESIIACTQLLIKVPSDYFDNSNVLKDSDAADAAVASWSIDSPEQEDQGSMQTDQNNVVQDDQSYSVVPQNPPQQNNWNNEYQTGQGNVFLPILNGDTIQEGYGFGDLAPEPDLNAAPPPPSQGYPIRNVPQFGGEQSSAQAIAFSSAQTGPDNSASGTGIYLN